MKKKILCLLMLLPAFYLTQVGIGNNVNTFDDSEVLKIVAANKGVLIPNISIPDLLQAPPVTNPANSLLVYNTNNTSGKGFYYWKNNKWNPILDVNNIYVHLGIVRSSSTESTAAVIDDSTIGGVPYTMGENPSAHDWQLIPGLTKTITLNRPINSISITSGGVVQVNSSATQNAYLSYSVGLFIDNQLVGLRNFRLTGTENCLYNDFNISFNFNNLSVGNHTVEVRETLRVRQNNNHSISFGSKHTSCSNINSTMDKSLLNIQIVEK